MLNTRFTCVTRWLFLICVVLLLLLFCVIRRNPAKCIKLIRKCMQVQIYSHTFEIWGWKFYLQSYQFFGYLKWTKNYFLSYNNLHLWLIITKIFICYQLIHFHQIVCNACAIRSLGHRQSQIRVWQWIFISKNDLGLNVENKRTL